MVIESTSLFIFKLISLALGSAVSYIAYLSYKRKKSKFLKFISIGFSLIAFGSFIEGVLFDIFHWDIQLIHLIESGFIILGLTLIAWALFWSEK